MTKLMIPLIIAYIMFSLTGCQVPKIEEAGTANIPPVSQNDNQKATDIYEYTVKRVQAEYDEEFLTAQKDAISREDITVLVIKDMPGYTAMLKQLKIERTADIHKDYFTSNTLFAVFPKLHSSSIIYKLERIYREGSMVKLDVGRLVPADITDDLHFEGFLVSVANEALENINNYDIYTREIQANDNNHKDDLVMEDLQLGELKLRMNPEQLSKVLQTKPQKTLSEQNGLLEKRFYEDLELQLLSGELSYVSVASNKYATPRGLKVGDSVEKLLELYGAPSQIYNNVYSYDFSDEYYLFHAEIENEKIVRIQINLAC